MGRKKLLQQFIFYLVQCRLRKVQKSQDMARNLHHHSCHQIHMLYHIAHHSEQEVVEVLVVVLEVGEVTDMQVIAVLCFLSSVLNCE